MKHPITHTDQYYLVPGNCIDGDDVGQVHFLWTHKEWWNRIYHPLATPITWGDYTFQIVQGNDDGCFGISSSGMLSIVNQDLFNNDRDVTVRISVSGEHMDTLCHVQYVDPQDAIFFDLDYNGSNGSPDGTRARPYKKWSINDGGANLNNGQAGKTYFWRRSRVWGTLSSNREFTKVVNGPNDDKIRFGAYGSGPRPEMRIGGNNASEVWLDMGIHAQDHEDEVTNALWNFEIYDIHINAENTERLPIRARENGKNWSFFRVKAEKSNFSNGNFWFIWDNPFPNIQKNIKLYDIESSDHDSRGIKFECGGVEGYNFLLTEGRGAPISATNNPNVQLWYIWSDYEGADTGLGLQCRTMGHRYRFAYLHNYGFGLTFYVQTSNDGKGFDMNADTGFQDIILDGCRNTLNNFIRAGGTTDEIDGVMLERIFSINSNQRFAIFETAKNTLLKNCVAVKSGSGGSTIALNIPASAGSGNGAINCTFLGFTNSVSAASGKSALAQNILSDGTTSGDVISVTNSDQISEIENIANLDLRLKENSPLADAGTFWAGYAIDMAGEEIDEEAVSIGAFQRSLPEPPPDMYDLDLSADPPEGGTVSANPESPHEDNEQVLLTATPAADFAFSHWRRNGFDLFGEPNPWTIFRNPFQEAIVAVFESTLPPPPPPTFTLTLQASPSGGGSVSQDPDQDHEEGEEVTIIATPEQGYAFDRWEGPGGTIAGAGATHQYTTTADTVTLTAYFTELPPPVQQSTVSLSHSPFAAGSLSGGGTYNVGTAITLTASANPGWEFAYWMLGTEVIGTDPSLPYTVTEEDVTITGFFQATQEQTEPGMYNVSLISANPNQGSVAGAGTFEEGQEVTVTATPTGGLFFFRFLFWKLDGQIVSSDQAYTFTMPGQDITLTGHFELSSNAPAEELAMVRDLVYRRFFPEIPAEGMVEMAAELQYEPDYGLGNWVTIGQYRNPYLYDLDKAEFHVSAALRGVMDFHRPDLSATGVTVIRGVVHRFRLRTRLYVDGQQEGGITTHPSSHAWLAGRPHTYPDLSPYEGKAYLFLTTQPMLRPLCRFERIMLYVLPLELGTYTLEETATYHNGLIQTRHTDLGRRERYRPFYFRYQLPPEEYSHLKEVRLTLIGRMGKAETITLMPMHDPEYPVQLIYGNSLGGFDSFAFQGRAEHYQLPSSEIVEKPLPPDHDREEGTLGTYAQEANDSIILRTGYSSLPMKQALKDLTLRNHAYLVEDGQLRRVIIENAETLIQKDGNFLYALEIRVRMAHNYHSYYGRDPRQ